MITLIIIYLPTSPVQKDTYKRELEIHIVGPLRITVQCKTIKRSITHTNRFIPVEIYLKLN